MNPNEAFHIREESLGLLISKQVLRCRFYLPYAHPNQNVVVILLRVNQLSNNVSLLLVFLHVLFQFLYKLLHLHLH